MSRKKVTFDSFGKAVRQPRKAFSELLHRALTPLGHVDYRKFFVLTRSRTGSNLLIQALHSHPNIASDYEIFGRLDGKSEQSVLDRCFGKQPFYINAKGFKIFYYHPHDVHESTIWGMLEAMPDLRVIQLKRRNYLRVEISSRIANKTGIYGVRTRKEFREYQDRIETVSFEAEELERLFLRNQDWELAGAKRFNDHPFIELYYEDMVLDFDLQYRRVLDFLGIAYRKPRVDFRKQAIKDMREQVSNYSELKSVFAGTRWSSFFED